MSLEFSQFYKEHQLLDTLPESGWDLWLSLIEESSHVTPGYRDGVMLKRVSGVPFRHTTVVLSSEEPILATYSPRVSGEEPRKRLYMVKKVEDLAFAKSVFAVLYRRDVLEEDETYIEADWAVVAHLTSSMDTPEPMHPDTLIANHFHLSGGTNTGLGAAQFESSLRESVLFWKNKVTATLA